MSAVAIAVVPTPAVSQAMDAGVTSGREIRADVGLQAGYFTNQDDLVTPRRHSGSGLSQLGGAFVWETAEWSHEVEIWFGTVEVSAGDPLSYTFGSGLFQPEPTEVSLGDAAYSLMRRLGEGSWWLGGGLATRVQHTEYDFAAGSAEAFLYTAQLEALGAWDAWGTERTRLRLTAGVPLVAWAARPPWSTVDEARLSADSDFFHRLGEGGVTYFGELLAMRGSAELHHRVSSHFGAWTSVRGGFGRYSESGRYTAARIGLDVGLSAVWGGR